MSSGISSTPGQAGHGYPFASFSTIYNNYFLPEHLPDLMNTSSKEQEVYSIKKGDIFLTRTSETIDELGISCVALKDYPKATFSGFVKRLRPIQTNITYDRYMGFYLRSKFFRKTMTNNASMTLRASLNENIFSYLKLYLPEYEIQRRNGDFLFLLNNKIELNNRINVELEVMAKTLYNYWFVQFDFPFDFAQGKPCTHSAENTDEKKCKCKPYKSSGGKMVWNNELKREIPEGWIVYSLSQIISRSATGLNPRDNFRLGSGSNYYITIKNVKNGKIIFDESCDRIDDKSLKIINDRSDLKQGDILFTSIEPVGVTYFIHEAPVTWNINESVFTIRPEYNSVTSEYLYMLLSSEEMKSFTKNSSTGSIHKGIRHSVLKTFKLPYFNIDLIKNFSTQINPILSKMNIIDKENQELASLRDWLLPMLMNGQVKVC